jgi:hypothetical protein
LIDLRRPSGLASVLQIMFRAMSESNHARTTPTHCPYCALQCGLHLAMVPTERRNLPVRATLLRRIHREFEEMPGMSLTLAQAAALFGVSRDAGSRILLGLTEEGVLRLRSDGRYVLGTDQT